MRFQLSYENKNVFRSNAMFGNDRESQKITNSSMCLTAAMDLHFTIHNSAATFLS